MRHCSFRRDVLLGAVLMILTGWVQVRAQDLHASYSPPVLKAPYTLVFSMQVIQLTKIQSHTLDGALPKKKEGPLRLTISNNGHRFLYRLDAGAWKNIVICDLDNDASYHYNSDLSNAIIEPDALKGITQMSLLPMPGVGYDICPMFQSFDYTPSGVSHAHMVNSHATGKDINGKLTFANWDAVVKFNGESHSILKSCIIYRTGTSDKLSQSWTFSGVKYLGVIPISREFTHTLFIPASMQVKVQDTVSGDKSSTQTEIVTYDPASPTIPSTKAVYTLINCSESALPDKDYKLETYLPEKIIINDFRQKL